MANSIDFQITEEGHRNAIVKLTGYLDTSNVNEVPAIALNQFNNNDPQLTLVGFRLDFIEWSISTGIEANLAWHSANPQQIHMLAGRGKISSTAYGGFIPDRKRAGYTGAIDLNTVGFVPGSIANFSIVMELIKLYTN